MFYFFLLTKVKKDDIVAEDCVSTEGHRGWAKRSGRHTVRLYQGKAKTTGATFGYIAFSFGDCHRKEICMKKSFGTLLIFGVAVLTLGFIACKGATSTLATLWIALYGPAPEAIAPSTTLTATLSLDFSEPVADLQAGLSANNLNEIFTFKYYKADGSSGSAPELRAVALIPVETGGKNTYQLQVSGAPGRSGVVYVTMNKPDIQPSVREWYLDGSSDYDLPAIIDFTFIVSATDDTTLAAGSIKPESTSGTYAITVTIPAAADKTKLIPKMTLNSGNTVTPGNLVAQDFSNPVTYTVTSGNGAARTYIVTVST
jgi:hypothetical protein